MYFSLLKKTSLVFSFLLSVFIAEAQYTETFESQLPNQRSFTSDGQQFTLTNAFKIFSSRNGIGYQRSNRFIDNIENIAKNQSNSIKTADGLLFTVKNMWIFASDDGGDNPSSDGSVQITGKRNGELIFTYKKSTGFNTGFESNNGFSFVDLATDPSIDYSNMIIDEISFELQGNYNYLAIDNFTWKTDKVLPVTVHTFRGLENKDGSVALSWRTSSENNSDYFSIEKSRDGIHFIPVAKTKAAGASNVEIQYSVVDASPFSTGTYYRLSGFDLDGTGKQYDVIFIRSRNSNATAAIYPNPVSGNTLNLRLNEIPSGLLYIVVDLNGKTVGNGIVSGRASQINITNLPKGKYFIRLSDGRTLPWLRH